MRSLYPVLLWVSYTMALLSPAVQRITSDRLRILQQAAPYCVAIKIQLKNTVRLRTGCERKYKPLAYTNTTNSGSIKNRLRKKGTPIPENDIWISAIAKQHDIILVTSDKHFEEVDDLKQVVW